MADGNPSTEGASEPVPASEPPLETPVAAGAGADAAAADASSQPDADGATPRHGSAVVWALAGVITAAGLIVAFLGAHSLAGNDASKARSSAKAAATSINATLHLATTHEEEIATSAGTFVAARPEASAAQLATWGGWARLLQRHPELQRLTVIEQVPASSLPAFAARLGVHVPTPTLPRRLVFQAPVTTSTSRFGFAGTATGAATRGFTGVFVPASTAEVKAAEAHAALKALHIRPGGSRASYCLALGEVLRSPSRPLTSGVDYCAHGHRFTSLGESGRTLYANASSSHAQALLALIPVYRGNRIPATSGARRALFAGWLREVLLPQALIAIALRGHEGEGVVLSHAVGASVADFGAGQTGGQGPTRRVDLRNGWTATIYSPRAATGVFSYADATAVLILGALAAVLAGLLIVMPGPRTRVVRAAKPRRRQPAAGPEDELHDPLTGLANRPLTLDRAERMLARVGRQAGMIGGALIVDLDHFGDLNEKLGAKAGDQLLVTVARRLEDVIRSEDTVGRLEGDRFVILVEAVARGARLDSLARRIIESLRRPVELEGFGPSVNITCSVGVAFGRYTAVDQLLADADAAVRSAKDGGRDRYTLFNANVRSVIEDRGVLETERAAALQEDQFFLVYQPICDLRTNEVVSLEALLRWRHPLRGMLGPDQFISVAEQAGLTLPIGRWALEQACTRAASWAVAGYRSGVSVAISSAQLMREGIVTDVQRALQLSGLEPSLLTLEVAESTVMSDVAASAERLAELRRLGVRVAIDDFGNGYAYRSDLQRVPVDFLKVDRSSLAAHEDEDYRNWLFEAILVFARDLSLSVVAKGVETAEQMTTLKAMGCSLAQGFFIGRPLPPEAVEGFLREHGPVPAVADPAWSGTPPTPEPS